MNGCCCADAVFSNRMWGNNGSIDVLFEYYITAVKRYHHVMNSLRIR